MGKVTTTITVEENLLIKAKQRFPRQLSKKFEEFLKTELKEDTELIRLKELRDKALTSFEMYDQQLKEKINKPL
ncbi:MAG: hypothetical protein QHH15_00405 [Candidatus Thermoplasmatota archaeon]|nr:hypothetical protein [Candidatus Thermoplasmatota archaeon]MDH7506235.1 hypothetical protein [Candidatus Thermoplasmatota archaeon]